MKTKAITSLLKRMLCLMLCVLLCPTYAVMADDADVSLKFLAVNGSNLEFSQGTYDYDILLPYDYSQGVDSALLTPVITAIPTDSNAEVTVTLPQEAEGGTAVVTVTNGGALQDYTITITGVGKSLYDNGGAELDTWEITDTNLAVQTDVNPAEGSYCMNIDSGLYYAPDKYAETLSADTTYLAQSMVRRSDDISDTFPVMEEVRHVEDDGNTANFSPDYGSVYYWNEDGTSRTLAEISLADDNWIKHYRTIVPSADDLVADIYTNWVNWGRNGFTVDEYFLGELAVASVKLVESNGMEIKTVDAETTLNLDVQILNQLGNRIGLTEESLENIYLADDYEGVTLSDGVLTIDDRAELGDIIIVTELVPSYENAPQDKVISAHKITITEPVDVSGAQLADIVIGGLSVPNFSPKKLDYTFCVPYTYKPNDNTFDIPEIKAIPKNPNSNVEISPISSVDGEEVVITVTSEDGEMQSEYTVELHTAGGNMYEDGGFEKDGTWSPTGNSVLTRIQENPAAGEWAMLVNRDKGIGYYGATNAPKLKSDWTYITQSMLRGAPDTNPHTTSNAFNFGGGETTAKILYYNEAGGSQGAFTTDQEWQKAFAIITPWVEYSIDNHFTIWGAEPPIVIDEYFVGELVISSMTYTGENIGLIPAQGEEPYKVKLGATYANQFGTTIGFEKEKVEYELTEPVRGLSIEDGYLYVSDDAKVGTARVRAFVNPTFKNTQGKTAITAEISLTPSASASDLPQAKNVIIDGEIVEGNTLVGDYDYYQISDVAEGESEYKWYTENLDGTGRCEITDNAGKTELYVTSELTEKRIYFEVTPVAENGTKGMSAISDYVCKPMPPYAINVRIEGERYVGSTITGHYDYVDPNSDEEDVPGAQFQWLIADSASDIPTAIEGANTDTYEIKSGDINKYITFSVKPKAQNEPYVDEENSFNSDPYLAASYAEVKNLEIVEVSSNTYKVSYDYYHPTGISEGETEIKWEVDGSSSSASNKTITVNKNTKKLEVTVTPYATKEPYKGIASTCDITISQGGSSISVSGGGGGGGFTFVPMPEKVVETPKEEVEVVKHWAEDGINFCRANGIMQDASQGNFGNLNIVTRAELVSYIIKALGEKEAAYEYGFKDVSVTDYYAGALQKAVALGIISEAENFEPNRNVTRQEVAKILVAAYGKEISEKADLTKFADNLAISEWATDWIAKSVSVGLLKGVSDYEFNPMGSITREQTAVLIKRLYDLRNGGIAE